MKIFKKSNMSIKFSVIGIFVLLVIIVFTINKHRAADVTVSQRESKTASFHKNEIPPQNSSEEVLIQSRKDEKQTLDLQKQQKILARKIDELQTSFKFLEEKENDPADTNPETLEPETIEEIEAKEKTIELQLIEQIDFLENTIQQEAVDPEWSHNASQLLISAVEKLDAGIYVEDVDCRSSLCRIELTFNLKENEDVYQKINSLTPWSGEIFMEIPDPNSGEAVMFVSRENYTFSTFKLEPDPDS